MEEKEILKASEYWAKFGINNLDKILEGMAFLGLGLEYRRLGHPAQIAISEAGIDYLLLKSQTEIGVGAFIAHLAVMELYDKLPKGPDKIPGWMPRPQNLNGEGDPDPGYEDYGPPEPPPIKPPPRIYIQTVFSHYDSGTGRSVSKYCIMRNGDMLECFGSRSQAEGMLLHYKNLESGDQYL